MYIPSSTILSIVTILILGSCANKQTYTYIDEGKKEIIKIDSKNPVDKFSNIFKKVEYVNLEETNNSIIGEISKLEITNNGDYIIYDSKSGSVIRFDKKGTYICNIGNRGSGPNEYQMPDDMVYNSYKNEVIVWDNAKSSLMCYNLDGKMTSRIQLPWIIGTFSVLDKEHYILYMNNGEDIKGEGKGTNYKIIKHDGTIVKEFGEYGIDVSNFNPACKETFHFQNGKCYCMTPFSSDIYIMKRDTNKVLATIDFQEKNIPSDWLKGSHRDLREKLKTEPNLSYCESFYDTDSCYALNIINNRAISLCLINKQNNQIIRSGKTLINDIKGLVSQTKVCQAKGNKLFFEISPLQFDEKSKLIENHPERENLTSTMIKELDNIPDKIMKYFGHDYFSALKDTLENTTIHVSQEEKTFIKKQSETSNPIIQICTLK
jgi:hypothetical protein